MKMRQFKSGKRTLEMIFRTFSTIEGRKEANSCRTKLSNATNSNQASTDGRSIRAQKLKFIFILHVNSRCYALFSSSQVEILAVIDH